MKKNKNYIFCKKKKYSSNKYIIIGKFGSTYSINGWIKVFSFTQTKKIFYYKSWYISNIKNKKMQIKNYKFYKKYNIICIKNIKNPKYISFLINKNIFIKKKQLQKLKSKNYYWIDIINCNVITKKKKIIGKVINLIQNHSHDTLIILNKKKKFFLPFIEKKIIKQINLSKSLITIDNEYIM